MLFRSLRRPLTNSRIRRSNHNWHSPDITCHRQLRLEPLEDRRLLSAGSWTQQDHVFAFDGTTAPEATALFGRSVAVDGDTMIAGAPYEDAGGLSNAGAAYIYGRNDNGTPADSSDDFWQPQARLTAGDAAASDYFGISVSIRGAPPDNTRPFKSISANSVIEVVLGIMPVSTSRSRRTRHSRCVH